MLLVIMKKFTTAHLGNLVKLAKQFIQHDNQLLGGTVTRQSGEANNISI